MIYGIGGAVLHSVDQAFLSIPSLPIFGPFFESLKVSKLPPFCTCQKMSNKNLPLLQGVAIFAFLAVYVLLVRWQYKLLTYTICITQVEFLKPPPGHIS